MGVYLLSMGGHGLIKNRDLCYLYIIYGAEMSLFMQPKFPELTCTNINNRGLEQVVN